MNRLLPSALAIAGLTICSAASAQLQRTFVTSFGDDANACSFGSPCRSFAAAEAKTLSGGEIIARDAAGFGPVTITKSLSIIANPGSYAGITASSGNGITIATPGVSVRLKGLNINSPSGGSYGIQMTAGDTLSIDDCYISGFTFAGIFVSSATSTTRIRNTIVTSNQDGIFIQNGTASVANSHAFKNVRAGFLAYAEFDGMIASMAVSDSVATLNLDGFVAVAYGTGSIASNTVTRGTSIGNEHGVYTELGTGGVATLTVGYSTLASNAIGMYNFAGTIETLGNNVMRNNTTTTSGTITAVALQ